MSSVRERIRLMNQMAMQEKEAAPDERGRSPGGVSMASNTSASGSPRPLSKVRTSFVAIADKDGRIGLHRQPSGDSTISERKLSGDTDAASSSILLDSTRSNVLTSSPDALRSERNRGPSGSFSRSPLQDSGNGTSSPGPVSGPAGTTADPKTFTAKSTGPVPSSNGSTGAIADPIPTTTTTTTTTTGTVSGSKLGSAGQKGLAASPQIKEGTRSEEAAGQRVSGGNSDQSLHKGEAQPARDQGQAQAKGRNGGADGNTTIGTTALNGADKAKTTKPAPASSTHPKTAGKAPDVKATATPTAEKKSTEKKAATSNVSPPFVKPRPKSPTQPMKLPERLTTHTGSSAAKSKNAPPPVRPASRTSMGPSGKGLGRSSSVTGRQHSSFGPPPKRAVDHPVLKKESKVDEGFLARMMRPTQAYANKVADKVQLPPKTPPRATATKKPASAKTGPTKKVAPRSTTTSAAASPETSKSEQSSAAQQAVKREDPIAEEPIIAKNVDEQSAPVKKNLRPAEEKEPMVKEAKQEEQTKELPKASKMTDLPKPTETQVDTSKPVGKENIAEVAETKKETPKAGEQKADTSKAVPKKDDIHKSFEAKEEPRNPTKNEDPLKLPQASDKTTDVAKWFEKAEDLPKASSEKKDDFHQESEENLPQVSETSVDFSKLVSSDKKGEPLVEKEATATKSSEDVADSKKASDAMFEAFMNPGSEKADTSQANGNHMEQEVKTNGSFGNAQAEKPTQNEEQEEW